MTEVIASVEHAAQWVGRGAEPGATWNPVYRALLEETGIAPGPAALSIARREDAMRLTPEQSRTARAALARGLSAEEAFAALPALEESLRDALTATGPRLSLALTLHDPREQVAERPVTWSRLWARGRLGLYRMDRADSAALAVHPVRDGDVLGTLLPVLEQALGFVAACTTSGGPR